MFGDWALSNHGVNCESELMEMFSDEPYYAGEGRASYDPLYYFTNLSAGYHIGEEGKQFTIVTHKTLGITLSIPNKILRTRGGDTYAHTNIYHSILQKKKMWLKQQQAKKDGVE